MIMIRRFLLIPCLLTAVAGTGRAANPKIAVFVDNILRTASPGGIKTPHDVSAVRFEVAAGDGRCRVMLEGLDETWLPDTGEMNFTIRFLGESGDQVSQKMFPVRGSSAGWRKDWRDSPFLTRSERVTVPDGAGTFSIIISSSGPASTIGIYAVSRLKVRSVPGNGAAPRILISDTGLPAEGAGPLWIKSGIHPSMASSAGLEEAEGSPVLFIRDDDIAAHADWETARNRLAHVSPGDVLEFAWEEAYSIGKGAVIPETYHRIPPGNYRFVAEVLDTGGSPTGQISAVEIHVPRPLWKNFWFWLLVVGILATWAYVLGKRAIRRKINRDIRHAQLISDERLRIARDLHDDLGTRLSHISLLGSHSEATVSDPAAKADFQEITGMCGELIAALSETVWLLNSRNNDFESLVNFLCRQLGELCNLADVRCRIDAMSVEETMPVSHEFRHNFSLAVKESINNAIKHSGASEIRMDIRVVEKRLSIEIRDNGAGLDPEYRGGGNGLESVSQRMRSIGGTSAIASLPEGGVRVLLEAPVK